MSIQLSPFINPHTLSLCLTFNPFSSLHALVFGEEKETVCTFLFQMQLKEFTCKQKFDASNILESIWP